MFGVFLVFFGQHDKSIDKVEDFATKKQAIDFENQIKAEFHDRVKNDCL